ncbi:asparagine synthase-related protein [Bacteroidota bacterium]
MDIQYGIITKSSLENIKECNKKMINASIYQSWDISVSRYNSNFVLGKVSEHKNDIYENNQFVLTLSGSINQPRPKDFNSDLDYIASIYENHGKDKLKQLSGSFSISIYDKQEKVLTLVTDRLSSQPIYYYSNENIIVYSSSVGTILQSGLVRSKFNINALPIFFQTHEAYLSNGLTFFKDINIIPPATVLSFSSTGISSEKYWKISLKRPNYFRPIDHFEEFKSLFKSSIINCTRGFKNIGVFISGGLDSRWIAATMVELGIKAKYITFGIRNGRQQSILRELSDKLDLDSYFFEINGDFIYKDSENIVRHGSGEMRVRDCHFFSHLDKIKKEFNFDLLLTGYLGGELMGAMLPKRGLKGGISGQPFDPIFPEKKLTPSVSINYYLKNVDLSKIIDRDIYEQIEILNQNYISTYFSASNPINNINDNAVLHEVYEFDQRTPRYVMQIFRNLSWFFNTSRPFMENNLIDFALNLPYNMRCGEKFYQHALNYCYPLINDVIWEKTMCPPDSKLFSLTKARIKRSAIVRLNNSIKHFTKGKKNILNSRLYQSDYRAYSYLLKESKNEEFIKDLLLSPKTLERGILCKDYIKSKVHNHFAGIENNEIDICNLINFELINRIFPI